MKTIIKGSLAVLLLAALPVLPARAQQAEDSAAAEEADSPGAADQDGSTSGLDQLLLEGLDNPLLEGLPPAGQAGPASRAGQDPQPAADQVGPASRAGQEPRPASEPSDLDRMLLEQLGAGEDVGQETSDPFLMIGRRMRAAEELISRRHPAESQRVQQEILDDLDRLIEQLQQQCAGGQGKSGKPSASAAKANSQTAKTSKAGSGENRGANQLSRESQERVGRSQGDEERLARLRELQKQVWGHLPARLREQLQSGLGEEFLPQYERLIEQYYQRLAEER